MSEVLKYRRVSLGSVERLFMYQLRGRPKSAYKIYSILKAQDQPMNYKNVHTRIKRLEELGLIERAQGEFVRGAINYQLTSQGIFYLISELKLRQDELIENYVDNIIFKILVIPYFEVKTIKGATLYFYTRFISYLVDCYRITLDACDEIRKYIEEKKETDRRERTELLKDSLRWQAKVLAFRLVTETNDPARLGSIVRDNRFMKLLREVHKDFDKGFIVVSKTK
jgi:predicted transcriptional regulator